MTKQEKLTNTSVKSLLFDMGKKARSAAHILAIATEQQKNRAISGMSNAVNVSRDEILKANEKDVALSIEAGLSNAFVDRLKLNEDRVMGLCSSLDQVAELPDPIGKTIANFERPNGLNINRVRTPLGVIGVIYEARPNVTADAGSLCLKAGNACILRSGSNAVRSAIAIHACLKKGLDEAGLPTDAIQLVETTERAAVGEMLLGLNGNLDTIVPRGGKDLVARVREEARVPVFAHLEGICHAYIDKEACQQMAKKIIINAKLRRPGICGALETLLIHKDLLSEFVPEIVKELHKNGCEVRGDENVVEVSSDAIPATEEDWRTEYLAPVLSIKIVGDLSSAISHIAKYGSGHTETIVTEDQVTADRFLALVDSAIVMHNASTQFADGGEFGMGAEIGIATGRIHARGPIGVEQLTTFKYVVRGTGQVRR